MPEVIAPSEDVYRPVLTPGFLTACQYKIFHRSVRFMEHRTTTGFSVESLQLTGVFSSLSDFCER